MNQYAPSSKGAAKKDHIAMMLFVKYNRLPMPNLRLSDADVEALITYMSDPTKHIGNVISAAGEGGAGN